MKQKSLDRIGFLLALLQTSSEQMLLVVQMACQYVDQMKIHEASIRDRKSVV
jgi:hypothetical protein